MSACAGLIYLRLNKIGLAYAIINELSDFSIEVVDLIPSLDGSHLIIMLNEATQIMDICQIIESNDGVEEIKKFFDYPQKALQALLGSSLDSPQENIWIAEGPAIGAAFEVAQEAVQQKISICDFRILRGGSPERAYVIFSGSKEQESVLLNLASEHRELTWTPVSKVSNQLRNWF